MWSKYRQKGAMLVLSAFILPAAIAFTGLAVDGANLYYHQLKLQNAVDAAAIAGAHEYADKRNTGSAETRINEYMEINGDSNSYNIEDITYRQNSQNSTRISVTAKEDVPLQFISLLLAKKIQPVSAKATAQISRNSIPRIFEYAMIGGFDKRPDITGWNRMGGTEPDGDNQMLNSIIFHTADIDINGKVHANGRVYLDDTFENNDGSKKQYYVSADSFSCTAKNDAELWSNYRDNYNEHYINGIDGEWSNGHKTYFADDDTTKINAGHEHDDKIVDGSGERGFTWRYYYRMGKNQIGDYVGNTSNTDKIDISLSKTNPMTNSIYDLIKDYLKMTFEEREKNHVYVDVNESNLTSDAYHNGSKNYQLNPSHNTSIYPGLTCGDFKTTHQNSYEVWDDVFKVIIVDGDLSVNIPANQKPNNQNDHLFLISLHGNISLQGSSPFYGYIYAPNGTVLIDGSNVATINGSIVAKSVKLTTGGQRVAANHKIFSDDNDNASGGYTVSLVKD